VAMTFGVNTAWLEAQTGVRYETLRKHYGKRMRAEGADQLRKLASLAPSLAPTDAARNQVPELQGPRSAEEGSRTPTPLRAEDFEPRPWRYARQEDQHR